MLEPLVRASALAPHIDGVLSVDAAGIYKPSPQVYQLAVDRLQLVPREIGFVSSNGWDAVGARRSASRRSGSTAPASRSSVMRRNRISSLGDSSRERFCRSRRCAALPSTRQRATLSRIAAIAAGRGKLRRYASATRRDGTGW